VADWVAFIAVICGMVLAFGFAGWVVMAIAEWAGRRPKPQPTATLDQILNGKDDQ
jgi:hypothetical protein